MDVKLENLIEKIKKEGVEEAEQNAEEVINNAKKEAAQIVKRAKDEAQHIKDDAQKTADKFQKNAELALQQAMRDTELLAREKITQLLDDVFKREVKSAMSPDFLKELILEIVRAWAKTSKVEVTLNGEHREKVRDLLASGLQDDIKNTLTIKLGDSKSQGFRIGIKDDAVYYDISDESIAELLKTFLNPNIQEIVDAQDG